MKRARRAVGDGSRRRFHWSDVCEESDLPDPLGLAHSRIGAVIMWVAVACLVAIFVFAAYEAAQWWLLRGFLVLTALFIVDTVVMSVVGWIRRR